MKRFFALLLAALLFLMPALSSCAEEDEMEEFSDDYGGFEEFPDDEDGFEEFPDDEGGFEEFDDYPDAPPVPDMEVKDRKAMTSKLEGLSGYQGDDVLDDKSLKIMYMPLEDGNTCKMMLYYGDDTVVTIPEKIGGLTVTVIGNAAFSGREYIETVVLPETVVLVDTSAFFKCTGLKSVEMQEGVLMLGRACFGGCVSLENISIPESLEIVDELAFLQCLKLPELTFGENLKEIRGQAFMLCNTLGKVTIPRSTQLDPNAFTGTPEELEIAYLENQ